MLSEIIDMAKQELGEKITSNTELDSEQAEQTVAIGGESIIDTVKDQLLSGNISQITELFSHSNFDMNNPLITTIASNFIANLVSRLGISESTATNVVNMVLPHIISMISNKAANGEGSKSENLMQIFGHNSGLLGQAANLLGGFFKGN